MRRYWRELANVPLGARLLLAAVFMVAVLVLASVAGAVYGHFTETSVSPQCDQALRALAYSNTDEAKLQHATVTVCTSRAEWLEGVKHYTGNDMHEVVIGSIDPVQVLAAICADSPTAPACR